VDAVAERAPDRVVVENEMHPQPGYPVRVALRIDCVLSTEGLSIRSTATNVDDRPCPYGIGAHPYLSVMPTIDVTTLHVPASTVLLSDGEGIPTGTARVDVMLFSGDPLPDVNWKSLAVEPMTFPPKAFSTGIALVRLQPGEPFTAAWGISPC
jgi:aldose 1-epimerase